MAKPGVVPLRQLNLGDIMGGAFQTIRRNPRASIGLALAVSAVFTAVPMLAAVVYGAADLGGLDPFDTALFAGGASFQVLSNASWLFNLLAGIVITGLMTRVVGSAVVGRPMRAGEAWARTKGRLWALVGLSLLGLVISVVAFAVPVALGVAVGLGTSSTAAGISVGLLAGVASLVAVVYVWVRFVLLAAPALVLEGTGVVASLRRAGELSRGQFWRLFGISLLTQLLAGLATQVVVLPLALVGGAAAFLIGGSWGVAGLLLATNLANLVALALVGPFIAGVTGLQYVDQRFRKEGLDLAILEQSLGERPA